MRLLYHRPVESLFQILFEQFRIESLQEVFTGAIVLWICSEKLNLEWLLDTILSTPVIGGHSLSISYIGMFLVFT